MRVLVTGGAGFIGSHLVDALVDRGCDVVIFDNLEPQVHPDGAPPSYLNRKATFVRGDVRDTDQLKAVLDGVEVVFHEASAVGVGQSQYEIARYVSVNTMGTAYLLDLLVNTEHKVKKLVVAASMSSYGEGLYRCPACGPVRPPLRSAEQIRRGSWEPPCPKCGGRAIPVPTGEDERLYCNSIYSQTKKDQEEMCLLVGKTYGLPVVALRYFNVYGPRQSLSNPYTGVAAIFLSRVKNDRPPVLYEDGLQTRDFIHVSDVVRANLLAMEKSEADGQALNVGAGIPVTIRHVAETLCRAFGKALAPQVTHQFRKGDVRHCYADISRIGELLGFSPQVRFEEGMEELIEWSRSVEARDGYDRARAELEAKGLL